MSRKVLSKEEFMRRALADLAAASKLAAPDAKELPKKLKRKYTYRRKKGLCFDIVERTVLYA